jgi:hypothetical protein
VIKAAVSSSMLHVGTPVKSVTVAVSVSGVSAPTVMSFSAASKAMAGFLVSDELSVGLLELEAGVEVEPAGDWDVALGVEDEVLLGAVWVQAAIIIVANASEVNNSGFFMIFSFPCIVI